jgi:hypothetical protein
MDKDINSLLMWLGGQPAGKYGYHLPRQYILIESNLDNLGQDP